MPFLVDSRRDGGFTLIELTVTLLIISILMVIGLASFAQLRTVADDTGTQLDLLTAVKVQALSHLETGVFTEDVNDLFDLEPTLRYSADGEPPGTVVVRSEPGRLALDVCVFSQTAAGGWFAVYHPAEGANLYGQSEPITCTPSDVTTWSPEAW